ncbi:uroporphyrinogen-III synthase [Mariniphaga anaerophila]|nr:uroporphyrinogen-III synthase [Mariniphaga anaerophila]
MSNEINCLLTEKGAAVLEFPLIEISKTQLSFTEKKQFTRLNQFQWLILTSSNGVWIFFEILQEINGNQKLPENLKIAAIGEKTKETLESFGYRAAFVNPGATAEDFSEPFANRLKTETTKPKVLLPVGNLARTVIQSSLKEVANCTRINIYQTEMPLKTDKNIAERIKNNRYDMLIFTSPSGIRNFVKTFPKLKNISMACIGDITAGAAINNGFHPLIVAENSSSKGIVESILNYYISKT